jgi:hypothetical protein
VHAHWTGKQLACALIIKTPARPQLRSSRNFPTPPLLLDNPPTFFRYGTTQILTDLQSLCCVWRKRIFQGSLPLDLYPSYTLQASKSLSLITSSAAIMSFSADKVNVLKGAFSQRRFSSSKDPSESGQYCFSCSFMEGVRYVIFCILEAFGSFRSLEICQCSLLYTDSSLEVQRY